MYYKQITFLILKSTIMMMSHTTCHHMHNTILLFDINFFTMSLFDFQRCFC